MLLFLSFPVVSGATQGTADDSHIENLCLFNETRTQGWQLSFKVKKTAGKNMEKTGRKELFFFTEFGI